MATLTGQRIKDSYKDLLQVSNSNSGIDSTLRVISDGEATDSVLQISTTAVNISSAGALQYAGVAITSTAAELNILDGATVTVAELNVLDGYTGSVTELNYLDTLHATGVTNTEFDYLDGVTSNIQTQLDATLDTAGTGIDISSTTVSVDVSDFMSNGANNRMLTATGTDAMNAEANFTFNGTHASLAATSALYFDGGSDTYIQEDSADSLKIFVGGQNVIRFYETSNVGYAYVPDSGFVGAGNSIDLTLSHDGSNSQLTNNTGDLYIRNNTDDGDIYFQVDDSSTQITAIRIDASHVGHVKLPNDNQVLSVGAGDDFLFQHDGTNTYIDNSSFAASNRLLDIRSA
jgi:hypothetical protein